jgi:hypothetical protein
MSRRGRQIPLRRRIFFGCEGESEQGYGALLQRIANDQPTPKIHLDVHVVKGGDPLAIVENAVQKEREHANRHGNFSVRAIFLDHDKIGRAPQRDNQIPALTGSKFVLVWQRPCFEAFILRHLPGCQSLRPGTTALAQAAIQQHWPGYRKPMSQLELARRIGLDEIREAAKVESDLARFLQLIAF